MQVFASVPCRGGVRRQRSDLKYVHVATVNVTSLAKNLEAVHLLEADCIGVSEARVTRMEQDIIARQLAARRCQVLWSRPVAAGHRGNSGRSGGTAIIAREGWCLRAAELSLELEAPGDFWNAAILESRDAAICITVVAYYGHPEQRRRTCRDLARIGEVAAILDMPLIVLTDCNIDDSDPEKIDEHLALQDAALVLHRREGLALQNTHFGHHRASRIDRVFVSEGLAHAIIDCRPCRTTLLSGHAPVQATLELAAVPVLVQQPPAPIPLQPIDSWKDSDEAKVYADYLQKQLEETQGDLDLMLQYWSTCWEQYLKARAGLQDSRPERCTHQTPVQEHLQTTRPRMSKILRRLANYVADLRKLAHDDDPGHRRFTATWARLRRATLPLAARYGVPPLTVDQQDPMEVIKDVLQKSYRFYMTVWQDELRKEQHERLLLARERLCKNKGINRSTSRIMRQAQINTPTYVLDGNQVKRDYKGMLEIIHRDWAPYYAEQLPDPDPQWVREHVQSLPSHPCHCVPLTADDLIQTLGKANLNAVPGPDGWRTRELHALPRVAMVQLAFLYQCMEQQGRFPLIMTSVLDCNAGQERGAFQSYWSTTHCHLGSLLPLICGGAIPDAQGSGMRASCLPRSSHTCQVDLRNRLASPLRSTSTPAAPRSSATCQGTPSLPQWTRAKRSLPSTESNCGNSLNTCGMPSTLTQLLESGYSQGHSRYRLDGRFVHHCPHQLARGVHQGCSMSVVAFQAVQLPAIRLLQEKHPGVTPVVYADDMTLLATSRPELEAAIADLLLYYKSTYIQLNHSKTQFWTTSPDRSPIQVGRGKHCSPVHHCDLGTPLPYRRGHCKSGWCPVTEEANGGSGYRHSYPGAQ